jgi:hypothetical protein
MGLNALRIENHAIGLNGLGADVHKNAPEVLRVW